MQIGELYVSLFVKDSGFRAKIEAAKKSLDVAKTAMDKMAGAATSSNQAWGQLGLTTARIGSQMGAAARGAAAARPRYNSRWRTLRRPPIKRGGHAPYRAKTASSSFTNAAITA